jgi:hypothetical protein
LSNTANNTLNSYIKSTKHGAEVHRALLISARERKLASVSRQVEDPVTVKNLAAKVRVFLCLASRTRNFMRKFYPKDLLR